MLLKTVALNSQQILELIKTRRTIRKYRDEKVPRGVIENIIEAARWAPSAHNLQPWKFVIIDNKDKIEKIAELLDKKAAELFSGFNIVMRDTAKNLRKARLILLIYADKTISKRFSKLGPPYSEIGNIYEIQSVTTAIQNMQLYSHSVGFGMAWYGMALFCEKEINELLGQDVRLMAIMSLGYPDEKPDLPKRKTAQQIAQFME